MSGYQLLYGQSKCSPCPTTLSTTYSLGLSYLSWVFGAKDRCPGFMTALQPLCKPVSTMHTYKDLAEYLTNQDCKTPFVTVHSWPGLTFYPCTRYAASAPGSLVAHLDLLLHDKIREHLLQLTYALAIKQFANQPKTRLS